MLEIYKENDIINVVKRSKNIDNKTANYCGHMLNISIEYIISITKPTAMK